MPHSLAFEQSLLHEVDIFDPKIHLAYQPPNTTFTLADLGLDPTANGTPIAGTLPFPLLSREGVLAYRRSILNKTVIKSCARRLGAGTLLLRNPSQYSKFVRDFWSHEETNRIVCQALGVSVEVIMDLEMGHTNIQVSADDAGDDVLGNLTVEPSTEARELTEAEKNYDPLGADSVIPWHYDSYPYVCIIMLSDTTSMSGGDTFIQTGDGSVSKVEGPSLGTAVVLQGGHVKHLAARAFGTSERITTISSYRRSEVGAWDNSYISNVRPYDHLPDLYSHWTLYRLRKMRQEIEAMEATIVGSRNAADEFPLAEAHSLLGTLAEYSKRTTRQMIDISLRDDVREKYGAPAINNASKTWEKIKSVPDFDFELAKAMNVTERKMPEMQPYLLDWCETKAKIERGIPECSSNGPFKWVKHVEYYLPDELARQGLKETLLDWMDRTGLLRLAQA